MCDVPMTRRVLSSRAPAISVVMPVYNGVDMLPEALDSLAAQSFGDFEVVVVDDCSTDATRAMVAQWPDPRVRLVTMDANGGPVLARNRGMAEARGRFVAALDHDDVCRPDRFARQLAYLEANPAVVLVGSAAAVLRNGRVGRSLQPATTTPALVDWLMAIENPLVWSSVIMRGDAARRLDPFMRPDRVYAEDFDLYQRIRRFGAIARLDAVLVDYRVHPGGVSKRFVERMEDSAVQVLMERHAALFGAEAEAVARLLVLHVSARRPVPDRAALIALGAALRRILAAFFATRETVGEADRRLILRDTARRWRLIGRTGLRAGTLGIGDLLAVRSGPVDRGLSALGYTEPAALLWSSVVGGARRAGRLFG